MIQLIEQVLYAKDNLTIKTGEAGLMELKSKEPERFIADLAVILADQKVKPETRQAAGVFFKRTIFQKVANDACLWTRLLKPLREDIKVSLLNTLITPDPIVKRAAADAVASVFSIELPLGEWPQIINVLVENSRHSQIEVRLAANLTLGFICEQSKDYKVNAMTPQQTELVLAGILTGIKENTGEIRIISLKALRDSLLFLNTLLQSKQHRDLTASQILEALGDTGSDFRVRQAALQTLVEFTKWNYKYLEPYLSFIFTASSTLIKDRSNDTLCKSAMEIWNTIATEYSELSDNPTNNNKDLKNYLTGELLNSLLTILLENLTIVQQDDDDEENTICSAAYRTLCSIGLISADEAAKQVTDFVTQTIKHTDWKLRQAGLRAFCSILEGADSDRMTIMTSQILMQFLQMLNDNSRYVQRVAGFSLSKIAQLYPQNFFNNTHFLQILDHLVMHLSKKPAISNEICKIIQCLAEAVDGNSTALGVFKQALDKLIQVLIQNAMRNLDRSEFSLINNSFIAAMTIVGSCHDQEIDLKYLKLIIESFAGTWSMGERKNNIQCGMLTLVHSLLISLNGVLIEPALTEKCYFIVQNLFQQNKEVTSDGLYVLGSLGAHFPQNQLFLEKCWPFIEHALQNFNEPELFKATIGTIMDLARAMSDCFKSKVGIVDKLLDAVQRPELDRKLKISIFICVGDIFLSCPDVMQPFISKTMNLFRIGYQGALMMQETDFDYAEELKQALIESTICVLHGVCSENSASSEFAEYIDSIFEFVRMSCSLRMRPTVEFVKQSLLLLMDICKFYRRKVGEKIRSPFILEMIEILKKHNKEGAHKEVIDYSSRILAMRG